MREIRFRLPVYDAQGEFLHWHYWGFIRDGQGLYFNGIASSNEPMSSKLEHSQQITGLLDKNGKEIYEGDIVKHLKYGGNYEVVYSSENTGYDLKISEKSMHLGSGCCPNLEVIGNIYENPELVGW